MGGGKRMGEEMCAWKASIRMESNEIRAQCSIMEPARKALRWYITEGIFHVTHRPCIDPRLSNDCWLQSWWFSNYCWIIMTVQRVLKIQDLHFMGRTWKGQKKKKKVWWVNKPTWNWLWPLLCPGQACRCMRHGPQLSTPEEQRHGLLGLKEVPSALLQVS